MFGLDAFYLAGDTVCIYCIFPHHFPRHYHWSRQLPCGTGRAVVKKTKEDTYRQLYHFWSKKYLPLIFGMGVVSGLVMAYQFGTNWSGFSQFAGSITGPLLTYEVLTAFFLEAGFLGVMLFGWHRVGRGLHFFATCMVALGTLFFHLLDPRVQ